MKTIFPVDVILCISILVAAPVFGEETVKPAEKTELEPAVQTSRPPAEALRLDITSIRGNQELPRVMVIVPWKDPSIGNLVGKPVNSLVDEVLAPIDRDILRRQTNYFDQLYASPEE